MSWSVEATSAAEDDLTDIWLQATDRKAVSAAQHALEQRLGRNPLGEGVELSEGLRRITVAPLTAYYEVHPAQQRVIVTQIARSS